MKVAFYTTVDEYCGVAQTSRQLMSYLQKDAEVDVITTIKNPGIFHKYGLEKRFRKYDLVHVQHMHSFWGCNYLESSLKFCLLKKQIKKPLVITTHAIWPPFETSSLKNRLFESAGFYRLINGLIFSGAYIIVHSDFHRQVLIKRGFDGKKVFSIPFGVPEPVLISQSQKEKFKEKYNLQGKTLIGIMGAVNAYKNYELALYALAKIKKDVVLLFAGGIREDYDSKNYFEKFKKLISELGLNNRAVITGNLNNDEMNTCLSLVDISVVPYSSEISVSYSVNLSIAYQKPTIVSDVATFKSTNEKYGCFELFEKGNSDDLAKKVELLLADTARRDYLSQKTKLYQQSWGWEKAAKATLEIYKETVKVTR